MKDPASPLLIIAGAGPENTNILAYRVSHLIVAGSDPRPILLMTSSRRASAELEGRFERIRRRVIGDKAGVLMGSRAWSATSHGTDARLQRRIPQQIGLNPSFMIHDREDASDLMNLVLHARLLEARKSLADHGYLSRDLLRLRRRLDAAGRRFDSVHSMVRQWKKSCESCSAG